MPLAGPSTTGAAALSSPRCSAEDEVPGGPPRRCIDEADTDLGLCRRHLEELREAS